MTESSAAGTSAESTRTLINLIGCPIKLQKSNSDETFTVPPEPASFLFMMKGQNLATHDFDSGSTPPPIFKVEPDDGPFWVRLDTGVPFAKTASVMHWTWAIFAMLQQRKAGTYDFVVPACLVDETDYIGRNRSNSVAIWRERLFPGPRKEKKYDVRIWAYIPNNKSLLSLGVFDVNGRFEKSTALREENLALYYLTCPTEFPRTCRRAWQGTLEFEHTTPQKEYDAIVALINTFNDQVTRSQIESSFRNTLEDSVRIRECIRDMQQPPPRWTHAVVTYTGPPAKRER